MEIRYINTTTRLPVDQSLRDLLDSLADQRLIGALWSESDSDYPWIDVFFVNENDPVLKCRGITDFGTDALGVYIPHCPEHHRAIIKVSPEKVLEQSISLCGGKSTAATECGINGTYSTLLTKVVIHELAHWLMDENRVRHTAFNWKSVTTQEKAVSVLKRTARSSKPANFKLLKALGCKTGGFKHKDWIEESLANAVAFNQRYGKQSKLVREFIEIQPHPYEAGVLWDGSPEDILAVAGAWRSVKQAFKSCEAIKSGQLITMVNTLISKLQTPETVSASKYSKVMATAAKLSFPNKGVVFRGQYDCSGNLLTELKDCPSVVTGDFICSRNNLTSLEGMPDFIGGDFIALDNPSLARCALMKEEVGKKVADNVFLHNPEVSEDKSKLDITNWEISCNSSAVDLEDINSI